MLFKKTPPATRIPLEGKILEGKALKGKILARTTLAGVLSGTLLAGLYLCSVAHAGDEIGPSPWDLLPTEAQRVIISKLTPESMNNMAGVSRQCRDIVTEYRVDNKTPLSITTYNRLHGRDPATASKAVVRVDLCTPPSLESIRHIKHLKVTISRSNPATREVNQAALHALAELLRDLPHLASLDFTKGVLMVLECAALFSVLPDLQRHKINNNHLFVNAWGDLVRCLPRLTQLTTLGVSGYGLRGPLAQGIFASLPPGLQHLNLSHTYLHQGAVEALAGRLPRLRQLTRLNLAGCGLEGPEAQGLLRALPGGLQSLELSENHLNQGAVEALAERLPRLTKLTTLDLGWCELKEPEVRDFLRVLPGGLQSLTLDGNHLHQSAVEALAKRLAHLRQLTSLDLSDCGLEGLDISGLLTNLPPSLEGWRS